MANRQLSFSDLQVPQAPPRSSQVQRLSPAPVPALSVVPEKPSAKETAHEHQAEWLCVYLPQLASEVFIHDSKNPDMLVVSESEKGRSVVHNAAMAAVQQGIYPGLKVPTAYTFCADIDLRQRDRQKEQQRLEQLAVCLYEFSSRVSLQAPNKLLLEIASSYSLFGGRRALLKHITAALKQQGHRVKLATATTPKAAEWLAQWPTTGNTGQSLRLQINQLPLAALSDTPTNKLQQLGCKNLGDVLRLPRAGLARRFGPQLLQQLDRALGHQPDPRNNYRPPLTFNEAIELPAELDTLSQFWPGVQTLLKKLNRFLTEADRCTRWLQLSLSHADKPLTIVHLRLLRATANPSRLEKLLHGQLERLTFPAPVVELRLQLRQLQNRRPNTTDGLNNNSADQENWLETLERIQLRLGADSVNGMSLQDSHQPENAWTFCLPTSRNEVAATNNIRPNWLLQTPRKLSNHEQQSLTLLNKTERIAPPWWQSTTLIRNYYIAQQTNGQTLWVYQCSQGWFCHGIFA